MKKTIRNPELEVEDEELFEIDQAPGFDHRVQIVDPKTGRLMKEQHYRMTIHHGHTVYERGGHVYTGGGQKTTREAILAQMPDFPFSEDLMASGTKTYVKAKRTRPSV